MEKQLVGYIDMRTGVHPKDLYYSGDGVEFFPDIDDNVKLTKETLEDWAICINSPWSQADEHYEISVNCKDAYTEFAKDSPVWKCEYIVVGYDCITSCVIGYGQTEEEALNDCKRLFCHLQEAYNPQNNKF